MTVVSARLAFGQRAGLVHHERVDLLQQLDRFGVPDQHAGLRAAADADHDRHRRRQAERARAGDDQHRHRIDESRSASRGSGPTNAQTTNVTTATTITAGTN